VVGNGLRSGGCRSEQLEQAADEPSTLRAADRVREEALLAPATLVEVDERVEVGQR
jgi:hypothetical protein